MLDTPPINLRQNSRELDRYHHRVQRGQLLQAARERRADAGRRPRSGSIGVGALLSVILDRLPVRASNNHV